MQKNLSIFNSKKIPYAFFLCLLMLALTESFVRNIPDKILGFADMIIYKKKAIIDGDNKLKFSGIILGDSRALGINAKIISDALSKEMNKRVDIYNFSTPYADMRTYYLFLYNYLQQHEKPKIVFISTMPESLFKGWDICQDMYGKYLYVHRFCELFDLADMMSVVPPGCSGEIIIPEIERFSYLLTFRKEIKILLMNPWQEFSGPQMLDTVLKEHNGGIVFGKDNIITEDDIKESIFYKQQVVINHDALYWFNKFIDLAKEHKIYVFMFNSPLPETLFEQREENGMNNIYKQAVKDILNSNDNLKVIQPILESYKEKYFMDANHLNDAGNEIFSQYLSLKIIEYF